MGRAYNERKGFLVRNIKRARGEIWEERYEWEVSSICQMAGVEFTRGLGFELGGELLSSWQRASGGGEI